MITKVIIRVTSYLATGEKPIGRWMQLMKFLQIMGGIHSCLLRRKWYCSCYPIARIYLNDLQEIIQNWISKYRNNFGSAIHWLSLKSINMEVKNWIFYLNISLEHSSSSGLKAQNTRNTYSILLSSFFPLDILVIYPRRCNAVPIIHKRVIHCFRAMSLGHLSLVSCHVLSWRTN